MATSRYASPSQGPTGTTTTGATQQNSVDNTQQNSQTQGSQSTNSNTTSQNMDPGSLAALQLLIQQLMGGGTQAMANDKAAKQGEINKLTSQREGYSKEAAFADAQGLISQLMRQNLEKLLPSINQGALGSGTSQSSMRALLTQKAALETAQAGQAAGLGAAVQYGGVANGMSNAIGNLLGQADPVTQALLNALSIAKGAVTNTQTQSDTSTQQNTNTTGTTTRQQNGQTQENKNISYDGTTLPGSSSGGFNYFGPVEDNSSGGANNSTTAFLRELQKEQPFGNITF